MKQYTVQITEKALQDMEEIYTYIAKQLQAPEAAIRQYDRIASAIESLCVFPERIKLMDSKPERAMGMRQLLIENYSAFFIVKDTRVVVLRVLYSASDISTRLLEQ